MFCLGGHEGNGGEKSFFQKLTVKHKSNMRENYCKKTEMEEIRATNDSFHIKRRRD